MFVVVGVGIYGVVMFYLFMYVFFKVMLFFGVGLVIYVMYYE